MEPLAVHRTVAQKVFWLPVEYQRRFAFFPLLAEFSQLFRTLACQSPCMVRETGLEPVCLAAGDFKSPEYTISPLSHKLGAPGRTRTDTH